MTPQQMTMSAYEEILPGKYDDAERMFLMALEELRGQATSDLHYTLGLTGLAQVYLLQDRFEEAETLFRQALSHYERDFVEDAYGRFSTLCHLGAVSLAKGTLEQSRAFYEQALELGERTLQDQQAVLAQACLRGYADVLHRLKLSSDAQAVENRIKSIMET